jgi:hypothetical protein
MILPLLIRINKLLKRPSRKRVQIYRLKMKIKIQKNKKAEVEELRSKLRNRK